METLTFWFHSPSRLCQKAFSDPVNGEAEIKQGCLGPTVESYPPSPNASAWSWGRARQVWLRGAPAPETPPGSPPPLRPRHVLPSRSFRERNACHGWGLFFTSGSSLASDRTQLPACRALPAPQPHPTRPTPGSQDTKPPARLSASSLCLSSLPARPAGHSAPCSTPKRTMGSSGCPAGWAAPPPCPRLPWRSLRGPRDQPPGSRCARCAPCKSWEHAAPQDADTCSCKSDRVLSSGDPRPQARPLLSHS